MTEPDSKSSNDSQVKVYDIGGLYRKFMDTPLTDTLNKLYEKTTYLDRYGGSLVVAVFTIIGVCMFFTYSYLKNHSDVIKNNWQKNRCNPLYIPFAGIIITFLTINFGASVFISYAYIGRQCWEFLTNKQYLVLFSLLYAASAALGTVLDVSLAWTLSDIVNAALFVINMLGVLWFLPVIKKGLLDYKRG